MANDKLKIIADENLEFTTIYIGMYGGPMTDGLNTNFNKIKDAFVKTDDELSVRIISNQIKEIKYENDIASFTVNGTDWIPLTSSWGSIKGDILNQEDLIKFLSDNFADKVNFNNLSNKVTGIDIRLSSSESNIQNMMQDLMTLNTLVTNPETGLVVRVGSLEDLTKDVVHSPNIKSIQFSVSSGEMQYSEDGVSWKSMKTLQEWGDLIGNIQNQSDLWLYISNFQNDISELKSAIAENGSINLTEYNYEQLTEKKSNQLYNLTDINF